MSTVESSNPRAEARFRVVADTNIFVSAPQFGGAAEDLWLLARAGLFDLFISPAILEELAEVLAAKFDWSRSRLQEALSEIRAHARLVRPRESLAVIHDDPSDDRILECAVEAEAHVIVSGDSHLRKLKVFRGIAVISLAQFLGSKPWAGRTEE
jgi:putative PIN family toxin of toxin-antitoxin system